MLGIQRKSSLLGMRLFFALSLLFNSSFGFAEQSCWELFKRTEPVYFYSMAVQQFVACFKRGECTVLLGKPRLHPLRPEHEVRAYFGENGFPIAHEMSYNPSVNCLGYVCLESGLPIMPHSWINDTKSFEAIIYEYFDELPFQLTKYALENFDTSTTVREGDLIVFLDPFGVTHAGIVRPHEGKMWVESKLGEGAVVMSRLMTLWEAYPSYQMRLFRKKTTVEE